MRAGVFYLEVYDEEEILTGPGAAFFWTATGQAVTNYHVINGGYSPRYRVR
jgi:S1-C subfamily serine protease